MPLISTHIEYYFYKIENLEVNFTEISVICSQKTSYQKYYFALLPMFQRKSQKFPLYFFFQDFNQHIYFIIGPIAA